MPVVAKAKRRRANSTAGAGAVVSQSTAGYSNYSSSDNLTMRGVERWKTINVTSGASDGNLLTEYFDHSLVPRLKLCASMFERVRYKQLAFEVVSKAPTSLGGGYVAAFIPDPDLSHAPSVGSAAASPGAVSKKWYESSIVRARVPQQLLYTSNGTDKRLSVPGVFVVYVDGPPNGAVSITINVHWSVELSVPSIEPSAADAAPEELTVKGDLYFISGTSNLSMPVGGPNSTYQLFGVRSIPEGAIYRLPYVGGLEYAEGTGDTGTARWTAVKIIPVTGSGADASVLQAMKDPANPLSVVWQSSVATQPVVVSGTVLKYTGNLNAAENFRDRQTDRRLTSEVSFPVCGESGSSSPNLASLPRREMVSSVRSEMRSLALELESLGSRLAKLQGLASLSSPRGGSPSWQPDTLPKSSHDAASVSSWDEC